MKHPARPTAGGTAEGRRPARYRYWRTGFGTPLPYPMEFWVQQAGEYHCRPHNVTGDFEYKPGNIHCFYQTTGTALLELGSRAVQIKAGDLFLLPPRTPFFYRGQGEIAYHWFVLAGDWPQQIAGRRRWLSVGADAELESKFVELRETLILKPSGYTMLAISLVFALMARLAVIEQEATPPESEYPDAVRNALLFLREHYDEPFDADKTADVAGVSGSYLRALFGKWVNESPQQYHTGYRMMQAKRLLAEQQLSISEVAFQVGFIDVRYFSRVFKQYTGYTPSQYAEEYT